MDERIPTSDMIQAWRTAGERLEKVNPPQPNKPLVLPRGCVLERGERADRVILRGTLVNDDWIDGFLWGVTVGGIGMAVILGFILLR